MRVPLNLTNLTFSTVIGTGTSNYLNATDSDGSAPLLDLFDHEQPRHHAEADAHTVMNGGATVTWSVP